MSRRVQSRHAAIQRREVAFDVAANKKFYLTMAVSVSVVSAVKLRQRVNARSAVGITHHFSSTRRRGPGSERSFVFASWPRQEGIGILSKVLELSYSLAVEVRSGSFFRSEELLSGGVEK